MQTQKTKCLICLAAACTCVTISIIEASDSCVGPRVGGYWCPVAERPPVDAPEDDHGSPLSNARWITAQATGSTVTMGSSGLIYRT